MLYGDEKDSKRVQFFANCDSPLFRATFDDFHYPRRISYWKRRGEGASFWEFLEIPRKLH